MPPIAKENELLTATPDAAARPSTNGTATAEPANKPQPVALEVPVTVNGARSVDGSDKREPFSETTKTVLVFGNGAVIRLSASVAAGQLLFLTNERTKKEVVCQVVKSKNYRNVSGYVELEFTEQVVGFWGMRFPGDRIGPAQPAVPPPVAVSSTAAGGTPVAPRPAAPVVMARDSEPKFSQAKSVVPAQPKVQEPVTQKPITPASPIARVASVLSKSEATVDVAPVKPVEPPFPAFDVPRTSDVKASIFAPSQAPGTPSTFNATSLLSLPEVKPAASSPQPSLAQVPVANDPETEALKVHTARLQEQLSSLHFNQPEAAKPVQPPLVKPAEPAKLAAQPSKSSIDDEELKIPAWLEPLARNSAAPVSTQDLIEREKAKRLAEQANVEEMTADAAAVVEDENVSGLQLPTFGSTLPIAENNNERESDSSTSGKGLLFAAIAAGVLLLAGGGWWYMSHQSGSAPSSAAPATTQALPVSVPSATLQAQPHGNAPLTANSPVQTNSAAQLNAFSLTNPGSNPASVAPTSASPAPGHNQQAPTNSENAAATLVTASSVQPVPAEPKKPFLGEVRLATPKITRRGSAQDNVEADPGLALSADQPETNGEGLGAGLAVGSKQPAAPAAPLPVGGDVKQAKMISPVQPVYPPLAKSQHVSGDVRIDALIDANGHVTTMKIVSGPTLLHQSAMDALKQWKYQPATLDGKPVPMHLTVTIQFRLQ
jgi:protein TonB